jgi:hypothetical protein
MAKPAHLPGLAKQQFTFGIIFAYNIKTPD